MTGCELKDIRGIKMRRQWCFTILVLCFVFLILVLWSIGCIYALNILLDLGVEIKEDTLIIIKLLFQPILIFSILSILNVYFFGKTIAVLTDEGVYTDKQFIEWTDIVEIKFYTPEMPGKNLTPTSFAYTEILCTQGTRKIYHMPLWFLLKAKRFNKQIKLRIEIDKWYIFFGVVGILISPLMMILRKFNIY